MNIINVLNLLGYEVLRSNHTKQVYLVKKIPLRAQRERIKHNKPFKLKLNEVDFDEDGDFYINFVDPFSKTLIDEYWHNNMHASQLYDIDFGSLHYVNEECDEDDDFNNPTPQPEGQQWLVSDSSMFRFF